MKRLNVLRGDLTDVPEKESNVIRVFLSSTFTDMTVERNELMTRVFPKLHDYFRIKGLEFQVVDLRWGIREEAVHDHQASQLCLQEIRHARHVSRGVCFIALLGDKYGSCPLPASLSAIEYRAIVTQLRRVGETGVTTLEDWYWLDENAVPATYILLPIGDRYACFNSLAPEDAEQRDRERTQWSEDQIEIRRLLQKAALLAEASGEFGEAERHRFFMAVTEQEIAEGILNVGPAARRDTLCFERRFVAFNAEHESAARYTDLVSQQGGRPTICPQKRLLLQQLKEKKLKAALPSADNRYAYTVPWRAGGVCADFDADHRRYVDRLCADVYAATVRLSDAKLDADGRANAFTELEHEIVHHLHFCRHKLATYERRRKLEVHCQRALAHTARVVRPAFAVDDDDGGQKRAPTTVEVEGRRPVVVHGPSGFGKTSLMAKVFQMFCHREAAPSAHCHDWQQADEVAKIIRFLGTSPQSCGIRDVLISIMRQLAKALCIPDQDVTEMEASFGKGIVQLSEQFHKLLWYPERNFAGKVLICIDSVDQLTTDDGAYSMLWLPLTMPKNVFLFVSMLTEAEPINCLQNVQSILRDEHCYLQTHFLGMDTAENILANFGKQANRKLTVVQRITILTEFRKSAQQAMFLKLAFELAKDWRSFTPVARLLVGKSCKELVFQLFDRLEQQHGRWLILALEYLTAAREGMSDNELEDVLSLDDRVLQDVYVYHLPPETHIVRLPPMLWRRARRQLDEYLVEKEAGGGKTVVNWYHRQFWEAARSRLYRSDDKHSKLADYFSGRWSGCAKPLTLHKGKKAELPDASRFVPAMPYRFSDQQPNLRKLTELPYHVIHSYDMALASDLLCDCEFLIYRLRHCGLQALISDFSEYFSLYAPGRQSSSDLVYLRVDTSRVETDLGEATLAVKIVHDLLVMAADSLKHDWTQLPVNIAGRLNNDRWRKYARIDRLVVTCLAWMTETTETPYLYPTAYCMPPPGGLLKTSITHRLHIPGRRRNWTNRLLHLPVTKPNLLCVPQQRWNSSDDILVYDLANNADLVRRISPPCMVIEHCRYVRDDSLLLLCVKATRGAIAAAKTTWALMAVDTGDLLTLLPTTAEDTKPRHYAQHLLFTHDQTQLLLVYDGNKLCRLTFEALHLIANSDTPVIIGDEGTKVLAAESSPDNQFFVAALSTGILYVYLIDDFTLLHQVGYGAARVDLLADTETIQMIITTTNKLIVRGLRQDISVNIYVYDLCSADTVAVCTGSKDTIDLVVVHVSEQWVIGVSKSDQMLPLVKQNLPLLLWDVTSSRVLFRVKGGKGAYTAVAFVGDAQQYLAVSRRIDPGVTIYGVGTPSAPSHTATILLKLSGHSKSVISIVCDPANRLLVTASPDNTIKVWDLPTALSLCDLAWQQLKQQTHQEKRKNTATTATTDGFEHVVHRGLLSNELDKQVMSGCCASMMSISHDQQYVATGCIFGRLVFANLSTGAFVVVRGHTSRSKRINALLFADDDSYIVSAGSDSRLTFWDHRTGQFLRGINTKANIRFVQLLYPKCLFVGHYNEEPITKDDAGKSKFDVWKFDGETPECIQEIVADNSYHRFIVFGHPENRFVLTWNGEKHRMFQVENGEECQMSSTHTSATHLSEEEPPEQCTDMRLDVGDGRLAVTVVFRRMFIVDVERRSVEHCLHMDTRIHCVSMGQRHPEYCFVGRYRNIDLVDLQRGSVLNSFKVHDDFLDIIGLSADDHFLTTVSQDKTCKLIHCDWRLQQLNCLASVTFHCPLRVGCTSADNSVIIIGTESAAPVGILLKNALLDQVMAQVRVNNFVTQEDDEEKTATDPPPHGSPEITPASNESPPANDTGSDECDSKTRDLLRLQFSMDSSKTSPRKFEEDDDVERAEALSTTGDDDTNRDRVKTVSLTTTVGEETDGLNGDSGLSAREQAIRLLRKNSEATNELLGQLGWRTHLSVDLYCNPSMDYDGDRELQVVTKTTGRPLLKMTRDNFDRCRFIASCFSGVTTTKHVDTNASIVCVIM